jgi:signal transduction histidine kinase
MTESRSVPQLLAVDDKPQNLYALRTLLASLEVQVVEATSGLQALSLTLEHDFCLAIVDIQMPEMDGYELVELLRGNPGTANLPIIFISALFSDEYHHRKGYDAGAVDFLSKPFVPEIFLSKVKVFLDLYHQRTKLQDLVNRLNAKNDALEKEIKQREQAEAALRKANTDKDKLFSIISHDLRSPFNILLGNTEFMVMQIEQLTKDDLKAMAANIHNSTRSTYDLLQNLLTWSQLQLQRIEFSPGPVDLHELVEKTITLLQDIALSKRIKLLNTIEAGTCAYADGHMVATVIRNLTVNALKFTAKEGQVTISSQCHQQPTRNSDVDWFEVAVTDTGIGISQKDLEKLFRIDVHHTTTGTAQESGTGLGLILCQEMVEKNGGRIWIESEQNQGTTVTFTIPAQKLNTT